MGERLLLRGNEAIAEAAIRAGCECYFAYPITPQAELLEHMATHMPRLGRTFVQAESEIAAVSMVYGAAAAGVRSMTSSSSPGISLKRKGSPILPGPTSRASSSTWSAADRGSGTSPHPSVTTSRRPRAVGTATTA